MRNAFRSAVGPLIIICAMPAAAGDMDFISRHEEGWFFYNETPEPEPAPKPDLEPEEPATTAALPAPAETIDAPQGPIVLSSAWLRENLPRYLDAALDNPTIENVETYKRLERLAVDKATKFAELNHEVTLLYPDLDANTERSLSTAGAQDIDADNAVAARAILESLSQFVGLLFFFNGDCRPCETQLTILNAVKYRFGFEILAVSLDGKGLPGLSEYRTDQGQAEILGVGEGPGLFLMRPPNLTIPVSLGVIDQTMLTERIIAAARLQGWITEDQYQATRPAKRRLLAETQTVPNGDPQTILHALRQGQAP